LNVTRRTHGCDCRNARGLHQEGCRTNPDLGEYCAALDAVGPYTKAAAAHNIARPIRRRFSIAPGASRRDLFRCDLMTHKALAGREKSLATVSDRELDALNSRGRPRLPLP